MAIKEAQTHATNNASLRKRVIYQSEALFAGGSYLQRIQSINYSFTVPRTDVNQYGQLGQIERVITEVPTVSLLTIWLEQQTKLSFQGMEQMEVVMVS